MPEAQSKLGEKLYSEGKVSKDNTEQRVPLAVKGKLLL